MYNVPRLLCGSVAVGAMVFASRADAAGCIVSGSIERECASISYETTPTLVMVPEGDLGWGILSGLDSWVWGIWHSDPFQKFRSDPPSGFTITIR